MSEEWKKRLLPASFRGIPFFIESHELSGGRKVVGHEPTDRDSTFAEDTGIKQKVYSIEAHVIGDNYFFIRDALIKAMDNRDKGVLIHPYLGAKDVRPAEYSITESIAEGRICRLSIKFIDAGEKSFPIAAIDAITDLFTTVISGVAKIQNAFQVAFTIASLPAFAISSTKLGLQSFLTDLKTGIANVKTDPDKKAAIIKKIEDAEDNVDQLLLNPATLASEVDSIVGDLADVVTDTEDNQTIDISSGRNEKLVVYDAAINFDNEYQLIEENTPTRISEKANNKALSELIIGIGISRLSQTAASISYDSQERALSTREEISAKILEQLKEVEDDPFQALKDINAKLMGSIPNPNENLSTINEITLDTNKSSIVLSYDLFESLDFEQDIISRNKLREPGFIVGDIEVLSG